MTRPSPEAHEDVRGQLRQASVPYVPALPGSHAAGKQQFGTECVLTVHGKRSALPKVGDVVRLGERDAPYELEGEIVRIVSGRGHRRGTHEMQIRLTWSER